VQIHGITGPAGTGLARWLDSESQLFGGLTPLVGPLGAPVARVTAPADDLAQVSTGLPRGPAGGEGVAIRLRRQGWTLERGEPDVVSSLDDAVALFERWGQGSVEVMRAEPTLLPELQIGGWFIARARARLLRRLSLRAEPLSGVLPKLGISGTLGARTAADVAFWRGVREVASDEEWRHLTTGYAVVLYHRLAGAYSAGEERLDLPARQFDGQMRLLRGLGLRPVSERELVDFHAKRSTGLRGRRFLVTVDDALSDTIEPLRRNTESLPQVFVPTAAVGGRADWLGDHSLADWDALLGLRASGVALGGHSRNHRVLPDLDDAALHDEIEGSFRDLETRLGHQPSLFAYPNGRHDGRVRDAVASAGYCVAFTTLPGKNGAGIDPYCLRRISVKSWDSRASFLWKVLTGEPVPDPWERWLHLRARARRLLGRGGRADPAAPRAGGPPLEERAPPPQP
jgi:Polysaccharide deacetylase